MKLKLIFAAGLAACSTMASANEFVPAMQDYLESEIRSWANSEQIVAAINAQNASTAGYDQATIDRLDQLWRAEVGGTETPTISPVLENEAAAFLRQQVEASGGRITEVFIMDALGLNVAASSATSDYWQGDEAKFSETYGQGAGAVHFGDIEMDGSTSTIQGQISLTIVDPTTGSSIGAMTVGVNAESLL